MNSNEEYLDSLLKSVEEKEASIQEAGIVEDLSELDNFSLPEELSLPNELINEEQDIFEEAFGGEITGVLGEEGVEDFAEEIAESPVEYIEEPVEEAIVENVEESIVEPIEEPEIIVQSGDTLLDILKNNPDRLLSPEQIENMFAHAEEENSANEVSDNEISADEVMSEELQQDSFDFELELETVAEYDAPVVESDVPVAGDTLFADDVQNMAEDEIMRLLQQSSDVSQSSDNDGMNMDFLFDDMSDDVNVAEIETMIDKAENNEPVSNEVEEMIQLGLKVDAGEDIPLPTAAPKVIINKIKDSFVNIFKKDKGEKEKKEKKEKKSKVKKSLFLRKNKKNKKDDTEEVQLPSWDSVPASTDIPLWDNAKDASGIPLWDNAQDASDIPLWDNAQDVSDIPAVEESEESDEFAMMKKLMASAETMPEKESDNSFFDQLFGGDSQDASDIPLWDNEQDISDAPTTEESEELDEFAMMEKLMANSQASPKENVDTSLFDQLFVDDSNVEASGISQEEFGGFVEGLFEQEPEVQMNNNDPSEISDLLNALENAETESDLNDTNVDLFAGMEQEVDLESADGLDLIPNKDEEIREKKEKKPGFFKRLFTLLTEEDEEPEEILVTAENSDGVDELGATSEENKEAMAQLDKEGPEDKKKKKKGKKGKKGETETKDGEEDDEDDEPVEDKKKKQKPKKQKKQKEPKFYDDSPKLSKKKIKATVLASISIAAAILVCSLFVPELFELRSARNAFYDGDYETSYKSLYGKNLSESDRIIFEQSEFLLALQRRVESYYNYMAIDDELRAVESLILEVNKQKDILSQAEKYGLEADAEYSYQDVLQILTEKYGVSEEDAIAINAYRQDALYTLHLRAIVAGEEFVCPDYLREYGQANVTTDTQDEEIIEETLEDILPEEEELIEAEFEEGTN